MVEGAGVKTRRFVRTTIEQLPASPTAQQLAPLAQEVSSVVTVAKDLDSATSSACD